MEILMSNDDKLRKPRRKRGEARAEAMALVERIKTRWLAEHAQACDKDDHTDCLPEWAR